MHLLLRVMFSCFFPFAYPDLYILGDNEDGEVMEVKARSALLCPAPVVFGIGIGLLQYGIRRFGWPTNRSRGLGLAKWLSVEQESRYHRPTDYTRGTKKCTLNNGDDTSHVLPIALALWVFDLVLA